MSKWSEEACECILTLLGLVKLFDFPTNILFALGQMAVLSRFGLRIIARDFEVTQLPCFGISFRQ